MANIAAALKKLPDAVARQVTVVFITTDPDRDTPEVIRTWLDHFDTRFIGLTGTQAEVDSAQTAMRLPTAYKEEPVEGQSVHRRPLRPCDRVHPGRDGPLRPAVRDAAIGVGAGDSPPRRLPGQAVTRRSLLLLALAACAAEGPPIDVRDAYSYESVLGNVAAVVHDHRESGKPP